MNTTFGRYRLLERLGQGGMAEVFKAKSCGVEGFEKVVVIKRILPELATSREFVDMFIHEAKLAVRLSHANVVQVFDLGLSPGEGAVGGSTSGDAGEASSDGGDTGSPTADAYYMAMEYVSGFDLGTILARCRKQHTPVPFEMAIYVASEVAKGLDHAHRRRDEQNRPLHIVHLDVSPQNVLCSLEGEVKVTDFGIAKAQGVFESQSLEDTRVRHLRGKYGYMSPEHAGGQDVDARSDLFSLGTVLYEMIAGVNPFTAPTSFETLRRVLACEYPPVTLLRPDAPADLVSLLRIAMAPDPAERFADAGRMYEALVSLLYAQGRRFSARHLADFLAPFRTPDDTAPEVVLDADGAAAEKTPVLARRRTSVPVARGTHEVEEEPQILDLERAAFRGERREVTALVVALPFDRSADTSRDDTLASAKAPFAVHVATIVARYGGRIVSRGPEQVAALFGLDEPDGRDTETATRCALALLRAANGERRPSVGLQIGRIHVSASGDPTDDERLTALVADARDLARVREGACAIGVQAMRVVRHHFEFETLGEARSDGVSSATTVLVRDVKRPHESFGRFVGRKAALRFVGDGLEAATRRRASVLVVRGDPGIGKSRLLFEVERRLRKGNYNVGWNVATCAPRDTDVPLAGIQCMLHVLCGVPEGVSDAVPRIVPHLRALGLREDELRAVVLALGGKTTPPSNFRRSLVDGFSRVVHRLCEDRPRVFAWDAAHGMDAESLAATAAIVRHAPDLRVLFVFAGRRGFEHPLEAGESPSHASPPSPPIARHAVLELGPLDVAESDRLLASRLGVNHVPPELSTFFFERAAGHPQMIEELVKALDDGRAVAVADGAVVSMRLLDDELALPKTLRGLVASRTQRLSPAERGVLQAAAVLSEPVDLSVLARMTGLEAHALEKMASTLVNQSLLTYVGPLELRFASPVVRDVVAFSLTAEASSEIHAAAAHALERDERSVDHAGRIAHHLYASGAGARASTWFGLSAERSLSSGRYDTALREYSRAIELADPASSGVDVLASWFSGLSRAVGFVRSLAEALDVCDRVVARVDGAAAQGSSSPAEAAWLAEQRVRVRIDAGRILGALDLTAAAASRFAAAESLAGDDVDLTKSVLVAAVELAGRQGDVRRAAELLARLEAMPETGDRGERHKLAMSLAQTRAAMGDPQGALAQFERAREILPDDPAALCERDKLRGFIAYAARDYRLAVVHFDRAVDAARELGLGGEVATNLHNVGDTFIQIGDRARAYGALKQSLALSDELGQDRLSNHNRMFLAFLDALAGDAEAEKTLVAGIQYAEAYEFTWDFLGARFLLARLLSERGAMDDARREYESVRALAERNGHVTLAEACIAAESEWAPFAQAAKPTLSSIPSRSS